MGLVYEGKLEFKQRWTALTGPTKKNFQGSCDDKSPNRLTGRQFVLQAYIRSTRQFLKAFLISSDGLMKPKGTGAVNRSRYIESEKRGGPKLASFTSGANP
jgi:hypothetical protein